MLVAGAALAAVLFFGVRPRLPAGDRVWRVAADPLPESLASERATAPPENVARKELTVPPQGTCQALAATDLGPGLRRRRLFARQEKAAERLWREAVVLLA